MSEPSGQPGYLSACSSPTHRALVGLLPGLLGLPVPNRLEEDLSQISPEHFSRIANVHHMHTVLSSALRSTHNAVEHLPRDLRIYFAEMEAANRARNLSICRQLEFLGDVFTNQGITALVLKGSAELLHPVFADSAQRFISDIDILIPEAQLEAAQDILIRLGGTSGISELVEGHHHLPVLTLPDQPVAIELHTRLGDQLVDTILPASQMFEGATEAATGLLLPSPSNRMTHLLAHAQISNRSYRRKSTYLRDCLEFAFMLRAWDLKTWEAAHHRFSRQGQGNIAEAFAVLVMSMFPGLVELEVPRRARTWAISTLKGFGHPQRQKRREVIDQILYMAGQFILSRQHRAHYISMLSDSKLRALAIRTHLDRLRQIK